MLILELGDTSRAANWNWAQCSVCPIVTSQMLLLQIMMSSMETNATTSFYEKFKTLMNIIKWMVHVHFNHFSATPKITGLRMGICDDAARTYVQVRPCLSYNRVRPAESGSLSNTTIISVLIHIVHAERSCGPYDLFQSGCVMIIKKTSIL